MKILLVDDNNELRTATREMLETMGHRVCEASDGAQALAVAEAAEADFLLSDVTMPGISGIDLADRLRSRKPDLPVLLITAHAASLGERSDLSVLGKPFSPDALAQKLTEAVAAPKIHRGRTAPPRLRTPPRAALPVAWRRPRSKAWSLAAAATIVGLFGVALQQFGGAAPELPDPPLRTAQRGSEVQLLEPVGPLTELPTVFRWRPVAGDVLYRVSVEGSDESLLWQEVTREAKIDVPADLAATLQAAVAYYWRVEALGTSGRSVAVSARTRFRVIVPRDRNG